MTITASYNMGLNASQAEVENSTFMLSIGFSNKVSIVLSNPALHQAQSRYHPDFGDKRPRSNVDAPNT